VKVITGAVFGGKVEVPADVLNEGEHVVILVPDEEEPGAAGNDLEK
jgi:hypothetical protein